MVLNIVVVEVVSEGVAVMVELIRIVVVEGSGGVVVTVSVLIDVLGVGVGVVVVEDDVVVVVVVVFWGSRVLTIRPVKPAVRSATPTIQATMPPIEPQQQVAKTWDAFDLGRGRRGISFSAPLLHWWYGFSWYAGCTRRSFAISSSSCSKGVL